MKLFRLFISYITVFYLIIVVFFSCKDKVLSKSSEQLTIPKFNKIDFRSIFSSSDNKVDTHTINIVKQYYKTFWKQNNLSGGFLVAKGNTIIFESYLGYANKEKNIAISPETPIHLASVSKNLTAMAILKLVESKKINLQQTIKSFLPTFPYPKITVFDLLTHRSGLPDYGALAEIENWWDKSQQFLTNKSVLDMFTRCNPRVYNPPNTHFDYCNTNYVFLALIIEKVTQKDFPTAMNEMIFEPLGMKNTYVFEKKHFSTASLSYFNNGKMYPWDFRDLVYGDKNIYSTPRDMFRYSQAMFSAKFLRKSLLDSAMIGYSNEKKGNKNYGFGFRLTEFDNGKKLTFHNGWWHGNKTVFVHLPDEKVTIIALGNNASRAFYSANSLAAIFGDYPFTFIEADTLEMTKKDSIQIQLIKLLKNTKIDSTKSKKKTKTHLFETTKIDSFRKSKTIKQ